jgi:hypothetical protein
VEQRHLLSGDAAKTVAQLKDESLRTGHLRERHADPGPPPRQGLDRRDPAGSYRWCWARDASCSATRGDLASLKLKESKTTGKGVVISTYVTAEQ